MSSRAAVRYAKALLESAEALNIQELIYGDMKSVYDTIQGSRELQVALQSPVIKVEDKQQILQKIFADSNELTQSLIQTLAANKRTELLSGVSQSFLELYKERKGIVDAVVITAVAMTPEIENKILDKIKSLTGSETITIKNEINPEILGGFILRVGDIQYDASIRNQFQNLKNKFTNQYN